MKIGIIIETKEYEKAWNAFRFAVAAKTQNNEVKVFLLGDAVECEGLTHEKFNINKHSCFVYECLFFSFRTDKNGIKQK